MNDNEEAYQEYCQLAQGARLRLADELDRLKAEQGRPRLYRWLDRSILTNTYFVLLVAGVGIFLTTALAFVLHDLVGNGEYLLQIIAFLWSTYAATIVILSIRRVWVRPRVMVA